MQSLALENYSTVEMNSAELVGIEGGDMIDDAWFLTPNNGGSTFYNTGEGQWYGYVAGYSGPGYYAGFNSTSMYSTFP